MWGQPDEERSEPMHPLRKAGSPATAITQLAREPLRVTCGAVSKISGRQATHLSPISARGVTGRPLAGPAWWDSIPARAFPRSITEKY